MTSETLFELADAARRLHAARADVDRLTDQAYADGATHAQVAKALAEKVDTVRIRRARRVQRQERAA